MPPPATLGKGGGLELMWTVDERDGRAVTQSILVKMLIFYQRGRHSAGYTSPIGKNRVSRDSPGRILLVDVFDSL